MTKTGEGMEFIDLLGAVFDILYFLNVIKKYDYHKNEKEES